jgi:hypothetical protein
MGLALADLRRDGDRVEAFEQPELREQLPRQRGRVEQVRGEPDPEAAPPQGVEKRESRGLEPVGRPPDQLLRGEKAIDSPAVGVGAE